MNEQDLPRVLVSEADGIRYLHLGTIWVQGAMRIRKPDEIHLKYVKRMMAWMLFREPAHLTSGHAVQLGLGAGALTRYCHRVLGMQTTAIELNPHVIAACRMWFNLPSDDSRLSVLNEDAAAWVGDPAHAGTADVLHVDLYDHDAASPVLDDRSFYQACHRVLADGGVMTVNLFGREVSFERSAKRILAAFGPGAVFAMDPTSEGNTVVIGVKNLPAVDMATLAARAESIQTRFDLPARKWLRIIRSFHPTPSA